MAIEKESFKQSDEEKKPHSENESIPEMHLKKVVEEGGKLIESGKDKIKKRPGKEFDQLFNQSLEAKERGIRHCDWKIKPIKLGPRKELGGGIDIAGTLIYRKERTLKALKEFTQSLRLFSESLKIRPNAADDGFLRSETIALMQISEINMKLQEVGFESFKDENRQDSHVKKVLSDFLSAQAELLSAGVPERKQSFSNLTSIIQQPKKVVLIEKTEGKKVKIHPEARLMLGIIAPDPIAFFEDSVDILKPNGTESEENYALKRRVIELTLKLSFQLARFKKISDNKKAEKALEELKETTKALNKSVQDIGVKFPDDQKLIGFQEVFEIIRNKLNNSEKPEEVRSLLSPSELNKEWPIAGKGEESDNSIDPRVELSISSKSIELFLEALEKYPENESAYKKLFALLIKIGIELPMRKYKKGEIYQKGDMEADYPKAWAKIKAMKDSKAKSKAYLKLVSGIKDKIETAMKISQMLG